jgi:hypothetical protein
VQPGKGLDVSQHSHSLVRSAYKVPSLGLGLSHSTLVDNRPNTKSLSLSTMFTPAKGKVEEQSFRVVVCRLDNRLECIDNQSHGVVERCQLECSV